MHNFGKLIIFAYQNGYEMTAGELLRTEEMQKIYFNTGRSKTTNSRHLVKLAADINLFKNGQLLSKPIDYKPLGDYWESLHPDNVWGGDWDRDDNLAEETFKDPYHFEMRP